MPSSSSLLMNDVAKTVERMKNAFEYKIDKTRLLERGYE